MKKLLISTAIMSVIAGTASAQMTFESAEIDLGYMSNLFDENVDAFLVSGRIDYTLGAVGLQFDSSVHHFTDYNNSITEYSVGVHAYKELDSGAKFGGYIGLDAIGIDNIEAYLVNYGIEGLVSLGAIDLEASIGGVSILNPTDTIWITNLDAYYAVSSAVEVSAGMAILFDEDESYDFYRVGASYTLPNMPLAIGASYTLPSLAISAVFTRGVTGFETTA